MSGSHIPNYIYTFNLLFMELYRRLFQPVPRDTQVPPAVHHVRLHRTDSDVNIFVKHVQLPLVIT